MYKIVQTGPKIQLGGLKEGLLSVRYHVFTPCSVNQAPIAPMAIGKAMLRISASGLNFICTNVGILLVSAWYRMSINKIIRILV